MLEFSFYLLDHGGQGYLTLSDFTLSMQKILHHWCMFSAGHETINKAYVKDLFIQLDRQNRGLFDVVDYQNVMKEQPDFFNWYEIFNIGGIRKEASLVDTQGKKIK